MKQMLGTNIWADIFHVSLWDDDVGDDPVIYELCREHQFGFWGESQEQEKIGCVGIDLLNIPDHRRL